MNIEQILEELNTIPNINRGGCAIVAYLLHCRLKYLGVHSQIVYITNYKSDEECIKNNIPTSCAHAVLKIGLKYYDTNGKLGYLIRRTNNLYYGKKHKVSKDYVKLSIKKSDSWNSSFDRRHIKTIANILKKLTI